MAGTEEHSEQVEQAELAEQTSRGGVGTRAELDRDRATGALLGLAVGDALGTTLEFQRLPAAPFAPLLAGPHRSVTGGGPFRVAPGQVTDDTQMATALAGSLIEHGGFDADAVASRYVAWARHAFDIGNQTSQALSQLGAGGRPGAVGRQVWIASGRSAAGNGSLMRTAPIAVFFAHDDARRVEVSRLESALTHYDPRCQLACAAFNGAIAAALSGHSDVPAMLAAAHTDLTLAMGSPSGLRLEAHAQWASGDPRDAVEFELALTAVREDLAAAEADDPDLYGSTVHLGKMAGFVRVAFRLAFWHLVHTPSYEDALVDTVNRGGDADTNGAIVGALLGAHLGASAIPEAWRTTVQDALAGQSGPWATTYHPRTLLALVPG